MALSKLRQLGRSLKALPNSLLVAFALFALLPPWSLSFLNVGDIVHLRSGAALALLQTLTYWLLPLSICAATLARSFWLIWLFLADCAGLAALAVSGPQAGVLTATKLALLAVAVVVGLIIAQKDLLFPFMTRGKRFWRRTPRLFINHQISLRTEDGRDIPCMLEDCSLTGLAVALANDAAGHAGKGMRMEVCLISRGKTTVVPVEIAWARKVGEITRLGLEALASDQMRPAFAAVTDRAKSTGTVTQALERIWAASGLRRVAVALFGFSLAASFGMPACGVMTQHPTTTNHRSSSTEASAESTAAERTAAETSWRQAAMIGQAGETTTFGLDTNDDAATMIEAETVLPGASIMVAKGGIKQKTTLSIRAGVNLGTPDLLAWLTVKSLPKTTFKALEFSPGSMPKDTAALTIRLPLTAFAPSEGDSKVDPHALVALYRVIRGGRVTYGLLGPESLKVVQAGSSQGSSLALTDGAPSLVELQLNASLSGVVQLVELPSPPESGSTERPVGDSAVALDQPRHIKVVCATETAGDAACAASATMLLQGGAQTLLVGKETVAALIAEGTTAVDDGSPSDVLIVGHGPVQDAACFIGSAETCASFADVLAVARNGANTRTWLLNCPMPATLPAGVAVAECPPPGDQPQASRILQMLSDPLVSLFGESDGRLTTEGLQRYLDQFGTDSDASFLVDPALATEGGVPAVAAKDTGGGDTQGTGAKPALTTAGDTSGSGDTVAGGSTGGTGTGGSSTGGNTTSGGGDHALNGVPDASGSGTASDGGSGETGGSNTTGANTSGTNDVTDSGGSGDTGSNGGGDTGNDGGGSEGNDYLTPDDVGADFEPPPAIDLADLDKALSAQSASALCKPPVPCQPASRGRCNGNIVEKQYCTVVNKQEQWTDWLKAGNCYIAPTPSGGGGQCIYFLTGTTNTCVGGLSVAGSPSCEVFGGGYATKNACP